MGWGLLFLLIASAEEPSAEVQQAMEILARGERERKAAVAHMRVEAGQSKDPQRRTYQRFATELEKLRGHFLPTVSLEVGSIGVLRKGGGNFRPIGESLQPASLVVFQVIDAGNILAKLPGDKIIWLRGFDASKIEDGRSIRSQGLVRVSRTTQYRTALGTSKTVLVIEPFALDRKVFEEAAAELKLRPKKPR